MNQMTTARVDLRGDEFRIDESYPCRYRGRTEDT